LIFYPVEENNEYKVMSIDHIKSIWDIYITIILIFSCFVVPYRVAFVDLEAETQTWIIINSLIDLSFGFDIIVTFNTAYYDESFKI
jgi:hypothetical protein